MRITVKPVIAIKDKIKSDMGIRLGNLTFRELAERHQFTLTEEELATLEALRQDNASIEKGADKCHIFDMPRVIVCGNKDTQHRVVDILMKYAGEIKGEIQIGTL